MKFIISVCIAFLPIFATNLLTYNVYERSDRVDLMLSFDAPYEGNIFQKRDKSGTSLVLNSLNYEQNINKLIKSNILQEIDIEPKQSSLILNLKSKEAIVVNASKTTDGFGLRIRVTPKNSSQALANIPQASVKIEQAKPTSDDLIDTKYILVLGVLLGLLLILFILKKFVTSGAINAKKTSNAMSWLTKNQATNVDIVFERYLDRQNKVVLLKYENRKFLVLVGSSNVLLDSFGEEKIQSEEDFATFFEENKKRLGSFLQDRQNNLNEYKNKLSRD